MANALIRNVRVQKRAMKIGLLFDHWNPGTNRPILRDIRGQNILPVITAMKRGSASNHYNHESGSTIDVFLNVLVQT